jgi:hypothetical protein
MLFKKVTRREAKPAVAPSAQALPAGPSTGAPSYRPAHRAIDRRTELESRAVPRRLGRCGWCGSTELHKDCSASRPPC